MKRNIEEVVWNIVDFLLVQSFGTEISIREAYDTVYAEEGYQWVQFDGKGWVSSKDGGKTYLIEDMDLFDVLAAVKKELKQEGRILDFSQWEDQCVGVPYNLEFVLREKKKRTVYCPKCGSDKVAPIVYGLPTYATMQRAEQGEFFLGGCMVCDGQSDYKCKTCEYDWSHEQLPSTAIKKVRYTIRTQGLETIENSRKWVYEVFPDGKCKCYTYHGREKNADFIEEEVVSENKIKTLYRELQKLIKMQYESVERICDGCNYTLQITYKDNRRKIVSGDVAGGEYEQVMEFFLGKIFELED